MRRKERAVEIKKREIEKKMLRAKATPTSSPSGRTSILSKNYSLEMSSSSENHAFSTSRILYETTEENPSHDDVIIQRRNYYYYY